MTPDGVFKNVNNFTDYQTKKFLWYYICVVKPRPSWSTADFRYYPSRYTEQGEGKMKISAKINAWVIASENLCTFIINLPLPMPIRNKRMIENFLRHTLCLYIDFFSSLLSFFFFLKKIMILFFRSRRIRYASQVLRSQWRRSKSSHPTLGRKWMCLEAQNVLQVHEDEEHRQPGNRRHLRFLPCVQIPRLYGCSHQMQGILFSFDF